jgi:DNA-directed RNA polymerase specialized sigma24 family protein
MNAFFSGIAAATMRAFETLVHRYEKPLENYLEAGDSLPEHLRTIVLLTYFQGLKNREVAKIMHIPLGTVKSRLHRALETLGAAWRKSRMHMAATSINRLSPC